jgi:hypothetical protein
LISLYAEPYVGWSSWRKVKGKRCLPDILVAIDKLAAKIKGRRSEAIRQLIEAALKRRPKA